MFRGNGRGIRIRTLNDGVRVRSVTVTLYLYIQLRLTQRAYYYNRLKKFAKNKFALNTNFITIIEKYKHIISKNISIV